MNYELFVEDLGFYHLTEDQKKQLYRAYSKVAKQYKRVGIDYDISDFLIQFEEILGAFSKDGYKGEKIVTFAIEHMESLKNNLNFKLLVLDSVSKDEKESVLFDHPELLEQSVRSLYAKTRLWKDVDRNSPYHAFLELPFDDIEMLYQLSRDELFEMYPFSHQAMASLTSRRKVKKEVLKREEAKKKVKSL